MKIYVLNVAEATERLKRFRKNYPSCLPEYIVWNAKTPSDVTVPDWWKGSASRYALLQNFIDILSQADDDTLIFEDDCIFAENFDEKYNQFLSEVPADANMIYLGAMHKDSPIQVSDNILRLRNSVCGHAIIYKHNSIAKLINWYNQPNWTNKHMPDERRALGMATGVFKCYSPLINLCGQDEGYSYLQNFDRGERWYNNFNYIKSDGFTGKIQASKQYTCVDEPITDMPALKDRQICSVAVYGNNFYALCFVKKQQELTNRLQLPVVCHTTVEHKALIEAIAEQECISLDNVTFILHNYKGLAPAEIWRYIPVGASVTHTFDVDNGLVEFHAKSIEDFNSEQYDMYTSRYLKRATNHDKVRLFGGANGIKETLLKAMFNTWNTSYFERNRYDEDFMLSYTTRNEVHRIVYVPTPNITDTELVKIKYLDFPYDKASYTADTFKDWIGNKGNIYKVADTVITYNKR